MDILTAFLAIWGLLNVAGLFVIPINSALNAEYEKRNILFYPLLIGSLSEKLNKIGVIIATTFVSLFFAPAIIFYFTSLIFVGIIYLVCQGFIKLFKKKD